MKSSPSIIFNGVQNLFNYLWLSVSSVKFYLHIFHKHRDYGIKYIANLALISALICTIGSFCKIHELERAFKGEISTNLFRNIDYILQQMPILDFDGQNVINKYPEPLIIKDKMDKPILAIDPQNNLLPRNRDQLPFTVTKDKLIIKVTSSENAMPTSIPIELKQLFGSESSMIDYEMIKQLITTIFSGLYRVFTYIVFPLLSMLIILNSFLDKALLILTAFLLTRFISKVNITMKSIIRLTMYSSGIYALCQLIFVFFLPDYQLIIWLIQSWTNILVVLALLNIIGKKKLLN